MSHILKLLPHTGLSSECSSFSITSQTNPCQKEFVCFSQLCLFSVQLAAVWLTSIMSVSLSHCSFLCSVFSHLSPSGTTLPCLSLCLFLCVDKVQSELSVMCRAVLLVGRSLIKRVFRKYSSVFLLK